MCVFDICMQDAEADEVIQKAKKNLEDLQQQVSLTHFEPNLSTVLGYSTDPLQLL